MVYQELCRGTLRNYLYGCAEQRGETSSRCLCSRESDRRPQERDRASDDHRGRALVPFKPIFSRRAVGWQNAGKRTIEMEERSRSAGKKL